MMTINCHSQEHTDQISLLTLARRELAEANSIPQIQSVRRHAESVRVYAIRASLGIGMQNLATELKLQAERLGGQLLAEMKLRGGDRYTQKTEAVAWRLRDLGIDKNQSSRWQLEATVPEVTFRDFVRSAQSNGKEISSAGLLRLAKQLRESDCSSGKRDASREMTPVSTKSHLTTEDLSLVAPLRRDVAALTEIVCEVQNHHELLSNLVESICTRARIEISSPDYRAARRYLAEITIHLRSLAGGLKRIRRETLFVSSELNTASM